MNNKCYRFEKILYKDGLFNKTIDATYIIHLEDNGRLEYIMKQLEEYHPTNIVYIVFNKGFKKCKKADYIINPPHDLVDANLNIFKHANNNNYDNILILEDDFIFNSEIKLEFHINNINNFLYNKKGTSFQYFIGALPWITLPYNIYNYILLLRGGMHSVIFSKKMREKILNKKHDCIHDWDEFTNSFIFDKYLYYKPLCYQLIPETENSNYWGANNKGLYKILVLSICKLLKSFFKILKLDKQVSPGYDIIYAMSKLSLFIIFIILIILFYNLSKLL